MASKLKVLHIIPSVSPVRGGPSKAVIEMVSSLRTSNVDAEIATTNDHGENTLDVKLNELIEYNDVPVRFFKRYSPKVNAVREFAYSRSFQRWIKNHIRDYDLIHVHAIFSFCSTYAMYQARKQGVKYIVRPIGQLESWSLTQSDRRKGAYLKLIEQRNLLNASAIHFTAQSEKKQALESIPELKSTVIPLGIHMPEPIENASEKLCSHWKLQEGVPTIVFLSRLHPKKGIELLVSALSKLNEHDFQLVIAGDGEQAYIDTLKSAVIESDLSKQCKFVGFVAGYEKNLLLQGADLFALTSHSENFGIAALEAMASGTAVLISNEVALSSLVEEHQVGLTTSLNEGDIIGTLREALSKPDATKAMGRNGNDLVKNHYQWPMISNKIIKLYQSLH